LVNAGGADFNGVRVFDGKLIGKIHLY